MNYGMSITPLHGGPVLTSPKTVGCTIGPRVGGCSTTPHDLTGGLSMMPLHGGCCVPPKRGVWLTPGCGMNPANSGIGISPNAGGISIVPMTAERNTGLESKQDFRHHISTERGEVKA